MTTGLDEEARGFSAPFRVRFDEAAPDGRLRTSGLLRYAQDLAWIHSASLGFDRGWYGEHALTWLVRAANVAVVGGAPVGAALTGTTRVVGFRRVWSRRNSVFRDAAGGLVATVDIDWVLVDDRGVPTRIPPIFEATFKVPAGTLVLGRVALDDPPADAYRHAYTVRPQELDPMAHVNNAVYADWIDEAVIAAGDPGAVGAIPRAMRLDYALAAEPGATLEGRAWVDAEGWSFRLADGGGPEMLRARLGPLPADPAADADAG
jgi:acyl-ACP thioesterase